MSTLVLVRHGQASFLSADYDNLTDLGRRQARRLGEHVARLGERYDVAYSGPLRRQRDSAAEAAAASAGAIPAAQVLPEWDEFPGIELGKRLVPVVLAREPDLAPVLDDRETDPKEIYRKSERAFEIAVNDWIEGRLTVDGVETWREFTDLVAAGVRLVASRHPRGARVVLFSSGGAIGAALKHVLRLDDRATIETAWIVKNASLTEILYRPDRMTLLAFNHTPHLEPALVTYR